MCEKSEKDVREKKPVHMDPVWSNTKLVLPQWQLREARKCPRVYLFLKHKTQIEGSLVLVLRLASLQSYETNH